MRWFAVYVKNPYQFEATMGTPATEHELYKVYPEVRPIEEEKFEERGLAYIELNREPNQDTHDWNPKKLAFEHRNVMWRAIERYTQ